MARKTLNRRFSLLPWSLGVMAMILFPTAESRAVNKPPDDDYWYDPANFATITDLIEQAGQGVTQNAAMSDAAIYQAVRVLSEGVAMLPLILYERVGETDKKRARNNPLYRILHDEPNPHMTSFEFIETVHSQAVTRGNGFAEIQRKKTGAIDSLWPLHTCNMDRLEMRDKRLWYVYNAPKKGGGTEPVDIPEENMLHIRGFSTGGLLGLNPIASTAETISHTLGLRRWFTQFFRQGATQSGFFEHPTKMSPEANETLKKSLQQNVAGLSNAQKIAILEEGMKWHQSGIDPAAAQALEGRTFQILEVARVFNIPPHLLMEMTHATFTNIESQGIEFIVRTLGAWLRRWEQRINKDLLSESEKLRLYAEFMRDALVMGTLKERAEAQAIYRQNGILNANEIRLMDNRNRQPGNQGDAYLVQLNMVNQKVAANPEPVESEEEPPEIEDESEEDRGCGCGCSLPDDFSGTETRISTAARDRLLARKEFRDLFLDASKRVVNGEIRELRKGVVKKIEKGDFPAADLSLRQYYGWTRGPPSLRTYKHFADSVFRPVLNTYGERIGKAAAVEANITVDRVRMARFIEEHLDSLTRFQRRSSYGQLQSIMQLVTSPVVPGGPQGGEEVLREMLIRLEEWQSKKANKLARRMVTQSDGAIAREIWRQGGVTRLTWRAVGDNCPFCQALDGRTVGIESSFVAKGNQINADGTTETITNIPAIGRPSPIRAGADVLHPPLHTGCDCYVSAATTGVRLPGQSGGGNLRTKQWEKTKAKIQEVFKSEADSGFDSALRVLDASQPDLYPVPAVGDMLPPSFEWVDEEQTDVELGGTAAFLLSENNLEQVLEDSLAYFREDGKTVLMVRGTDRGPQGMPERNATIIEDPEVIMIFNRLGKILAER